MEENLKNSTIHDTASLKQNVFIENSDIEKEVILYENSRVNNSFVGEKSIVGDFSRLTSSKLEKFNRVDRNSLIYHSEIGAFSYFGTRNVIMHSEIGKFCSVSWNVTIGPANHDYNRITSHDFLYNDYYGINEGIEIYDRFNKKTIIGNDVWIGTNAIVLNGVRIGNGAVIGANTVVTKDVPPYAIFVGNPGKVIKFRFEKEIINQLESIKWWDWPLNKIKENFNLISRNPTEDILKKLQNSI